MNKLTTIARLPGTGGGQASKLPAEVGKQAVPDITKPPGWGALYMIKVGDTVTFESEPFPGFGTVAKITSVRTWPEPTPADRQGFAPFEYEERN